MGAKNSRSRRDRGKQSTTAADALDTLLYQRNSAAFNIRGIRYQVRYAMLRAVEMALTVRAVTPSAPAPDPKSATSAVPVRRH